jgi:plastocyanin domain-containing protein
MKAIIFAFVFCFSFQAQSEWTFDFSRRSKDIKDYEKMMPKESLKQKTIFQSVFEPSVPLQEVVIMNTDRGFIPSTLNVKEGMRYKVHIVNINETEKNISFVMDAFSEHHATYFGKVKTFTIEPKKSGVYSFQCPETSAQGRLVVYPGRSALGPRLPASQE